VRWGRPRRPARTGARCPPLVPVPGLRLALSVHSAAELARVAAAQRTATQDIQLGDPSRTSTPAPALSPLTGGYASVGHSSPKPRRLGQGRVCRRLPVRPKTSDRDESALVGKDQRSLSARRGRRLLRSACASEHASHQQPWLLGCGAGPAGPRFRGAGGRAWALVPPVLVNRSTPCQHSAVRASPRRPGPRRRSRQTARR